MKVESWLGNFLAQFKYIYWNFSISIEKQIMFSFNAKIVGMTDSKGLISHPVQAYRYICYPPPSCLTVPNKTYFQGKVQY